MGKISVVDFSVLKPDAYARLADEDAKALVEVQEAKEIAPALAQVTATLLGTTVWWKLQSSCRACNSGTQSFGYTLAKLLGLSCRSGLQRCLASMLRGHGWGIDHLSPEVVPAAAFLLFDRFVYMLRVCAQVLMPYMSFFPSSS